MPCFLGPFTYSLLHAVATSPQHAHSSVAIGSLSLAANLMALATGMKGPAQDELIPALCREHSELNWATADVHDPIHRLSSRSHGPTMDYDQATSIWARPALKPAYVDLIHRKLHCRALTLGGEHPADLVDAWAANATHGRLPRLVPDGLDLSSANLVIATAVMFTGQWAHGFNPAMTRAAPFFDGRGNVVVDAVALMQIDGEFHHRHTPGMGDTVHLPYYSWMAGQVNTSHASEVYAAFVLPEEGHTPEDVLAFHRAELNAAVLHDVPMEKQEVFEWRHTPGSLFVPRFTLDFHADVSEAVQQADIHEIFEEPDVSPMLQGRLAHGLVKVHSVLHRAKIEVAEKGTGHGFMRDPAAQASHLMPPHPFRMRLDRPFLMFLVEKNTRAVLMSAVVRSPTPFNAAAVVEEDAAVQRSEL